MAPVGASTEPVCYILLYSFMHYKTKHTHNIVHTVENSSEREYDDERDVMKEKKKKGKPV